MVATENQMTCVLERLAARHLTDDEIVDATLGKSGTHFDINRDKRRGERLGNSRRRGRTTITLPPSWTTVRKMPFVEDVGRRGRP